MVLFTTPLMVSELRKNCSGNFSREMLESLLLPCKTKAIPYPLTLPLLLLPHL